MQIKKLRYKLQDDYHREYEDALVSIREDINIKQGTAMAEDIADEIRTWFKEYKTRTGKFPEFPSEDSGGSRHLLSRQGISFSKS